MSGLTTTGSTVLNHLDDLPQSINLWRHTLHWIGGIGIIVLVVAVLPLLGVGGMQLYKAETPGPVKDEKLTPRITETAKALWFTYLAITAVGVVGLRVAGMSWFDAICHGVLGDRARRLLHARRERGLLRFVRRRAGAHRHHGGGGAEFFAPLPRVPQPVVQALPHGFRRQGGAHRARRFGGAGVGAARGSTERIPTTMEGFRHSVFNVVSIATTTGFVTEDYEKWPAFLPVWLLFLSCITCSTGSTGGGIKMFRTLLLVRQARRELKLLVHPERHDPDPHRRPCHPRSRGVLGAGVHLSLFRHDAWCSRSRCWLPGSTWCRRSRRPWAR